MNGVTLTTGAGGYEDGECADGGLYTIGGDGDGPEAERYDVTAWVADGDTELGVDLFGRTRDDLLFALWVWAPGTTLDCSMGPDDDQDGTSDRCDVCPGFDDVVDADVDGYPDGCDVCPLGDDAVDTDEDGSADACDLCPGTDEDGDGLPDPCTALDWLSPKRGPVDGGVATRLVGLGFDPSCQAEFDGVAVPTSFVDPTALAALPVAHGAGLVDVTVTCARGVSTLRGGYTFHEGDAGSAVVPELWSVLPNQVATAGGETVVALGLGFAPGAVVTVDGVGVEVLERHGARLSIVTPPHPEGTAALTVTNPDGLADILEGALLYVESAPEPVEEPDATEPAGTETGCATAPGGGLTAALLAMLGLRRRRWRLLAVLAATGCSEYGFESRDAPEAPTRGLPPVAITGPASQVTRGASADLDGTASTDPDQDPPRLSYAWEVTSAPPGATVTLSDPTSPSPRVWADTLGLYVVSLEVTDEEGLLSTNPAAQAVEVVPWEDLEVSLAWDAAVDLDLHLLSPGGAYYGPGDCFFANPAPDWGVGSAAGDDPWLSADDDGAGPTGGETVRLPEPVEGTYTVLAVYWNDRGEPQEAEATIEVRAEGTVLAVVPMTLGGVGDARIVGTLDWRSLDWVPDGSATTHDALGGPPFNE